MSDGDNKRPSQADERLKSFAERIARLINERREAAAAFNADIKEIVSEAKDCGFDSKLLRKTASELARQDRMDKDDLDEELTILELYFDAAGVRRP